MTAEALSAKAEATTDDFSISVVMPIYAGTPPAQLRRALSSVYEQTHLPDEVVVVEDGPLEPDHYSVLREFAHGYPEMRRIVLTTNCGRGLASQQGLLFARGAWIAKADADDICMPTRLEREIECVRGQNIDVVGAAMWEFEDDENHPTALRAMPTTHQRIAESMRFNNPINNPTVLFRREAALSVGGYTDMRMEDYDLWARMLASGARMANLSVPVVLFRADDSMLRRRASWLLIKAEWRMQTNLRRYGIISAAGVMRNLVLRLGFRLLPRPVLRLAYRTVFTKHTTAC